ncbi:acyl carrier protein [Streptomyces sp. NPDC003011]
MSDNVHTFIVDALKSMNYDVAEITGETPLGPAGLDLESLALAELAIQVEDSYGVRMDEDETEQLALLTVDQLAAEIAKRAASVAAAGGK